MKRILAAAVGLTLLAGCSQPLDKTAQAVSPADAKPAAAKESLAFVELDVAEQKEAAIQLLTVHERSVPQVIRSNGRLTINENTTWRVGAVTNGRIVSADGKVGDIVKRGQVLARMHSHDIHESRAEYRKAVVEQSRQKANEEFALRNRDRMKRLYDLKAASFEQLDHSENELKNTRVALANAEVEVNRTKQHLVDFLEVPVEDSHQHDVRIDDPEHTLADHLDDLIPIKAPADGVIVARNVTPGAVVSASNDLFVIADLSMIWAIASVQEEYLSQVRLGMSARVSVQAYPDRFFTGRIAKVAETLDAATRTVSVRIEIANKRGLLKPEMYATVELDAGGSEPALFVPQTAAQDVNGQTVIFVREGPTRFGVRPVEVGRTLEDLVQVKRGLKSGDQVVTRGSFILKSQLLKASMSEE